MTVTTRPRDELIGLVLTLHLAGLPCRVISCELGVSYHTVRRLLAAYAGAKRPPIVSAPTTSSPDEDTTT